MLTKKKLASLAMAGVMTLSLAAPAFAASSSESTSNRSLKVTGAYQAVAINVVVPTTGTVVINPYALPVEIGKDADGAAVKVQQQIVTKPLVIKNQSDIKLDMNISATTATTGNLSLATSDISDITTETKNSAYVYLQAATTTLEGEKDGDDLTEGAINAAYKDFKWADLDTTNGIVLKAGSTAQAVTGIVTLAANTMEDDGSFGSYTKGAIAFLKFDGSCAQNPKTAWTTKDGLTCTIAFTFTPNTASATTTTTPTN
jgi:hypothetical protein